MSIETTEEAIATRAFIQGDTAFVNSWDVAADFGVDHAVLLEAITEVRSVAQRPEWFSDRLRNVDGSEVPTVDLSYSGFSCVQVPDPHGTNLDKLVGYIAALSAADALAKSPNGGVH